MTGTGTPYIDFENKIPILISSRYIQNEDQKWSNVQDLELIEIYSDMFTITDELDRTLNQHLIQKEC